MPIFLPQPLYLLRHGEVPANAAGLRCGGENDEALNAAGTAQIQALAARWRDGTPRWRPGLILCGSLQRTQQSAAIVAAALGAPPLRLCPRLNERRLGDWNGRPLAATEAALRAGETPPGGESENAFALRIAAALDEDVLPYLDCMPLLVTSKGVARQLFALAGGRERLALGNGELVAIRSTAGGGACVEKL